MKTRLVLGAALIIGSATAWGHHAFSAEFDVNKPINFKGVLTKVEFVNPHSWFHVDVKQPDGSVQSWMVEAGTPNVLFRRGITKRSIPIGTEIVVDGFQAKDGSLKGSGRDLTLPDGRKLLVSSAETPSK
ncbi:MAG: hypothetical protein EXQ47_10945 [Bryobacterales bacterium]|nr:hypothetical protein [Bryobacterales bacterium]